MINTDFSYDKVTASKAYDRVSAGLAMGTVGGVTAAGMLHESRLSPEQKARRQQVHDTWVKNSKQKGVDVNPFARLVAKPSDSWENLENLAREQYADTEVNPTLAGLAGTGIAGTSAYYLPKIKKASGFSYMSRIINFNG
jgi:hypothetical protein